MLTLFGFYAGIAWSSFCLLGLKGLKADVDLLVCGTLPATIMEVEEHIPRGHAILFHDCFREGTLGLQPCPQKVVRPLDPPGTHPNHLLRK